ncbi:MAG: hypothetical protein IPN90_04530 [Elusimicrobia bacterium]|nr:hypothetical protein [Elusimicrobiota bacterium]
MNSGSKLLSSSLRRSWSWIAGVSTVVSVLALGGGFFILFPPSAIVGGAPRCWRGCGNVFHPSGLVVGGDRWSSLSLQQLTRRSLEEFGTVSVALSQPDYWRMVVPVRWWPPGSLFLGRSPARGFSVNVFGHGESFVSNVWL